MGIQKIKSLKCWKCVWSLFLEIIVEQSIQTLALGISLLNPTPLMNSNTLAKILNEAINIADTVCNKTNLIKRQLLALLKKTYWWLTFY